MEQITWHFPQPYTHRKLNLEEEKQLFYDISDGLSEILKRKVIINNGNPIDFDWAALYEASNFNLYIRFHKFPIVKDPITWEPVKFEKQIMIDWFYVRPNSQGLGIEVIKYLIQTLSATTYDKVILDPKNEKARRFWKKAGFKESINYDRQLVLKIPH